MKKGVLIIALTVVSGLLLVYLAWGAMLERKSTEVDIEMKTRPYAH